MFPFLASILLFRPAAGSGPPWPLGLKHSADVFETRWYASSLLPANARCITPEPCATSQRAQNLLTPNAFVTGHCAKDAIPLESG